MLSRTSKSTAQLAERPTLVDPWIIALLAVLVGGALWLMYPRQDLERRLTESSRKDAELSLAYLRNLLHSDPDNPYLQALLQEHLAREAKKRDEEQAKEAFRNAAGPAHREAWLRWNASLDAYHSLAEADAQRSALRSQLIAQLEVFAAADLPAGILPALGDQASNIGEPAQAAQFFVRAATAASSIDQAVHYYLRAAKEALNAADYARSAQLLIEAKRKTDDPKRAKAYYLQALATMQASGKAGQALSLAQQELQGLEADTEALQAIVELARAAGQPAIAERYMKQLLKLALLRQWTNVAAIGPSETWPSLAPAHFQPPDQAKAETAMVMQTPWHSRNEASWRMRTTATEEQGGPGLPFDDKIYSLGYQVFLENRNMEDAWKVARAAVQQAPNQLVWRERLAQVSEWTNRPALALENWLAIARATNQDAAWQSVLRLAPGLFNDEALVDGLRYEMRRQPHNSRLLKEIVAAYERLGNPRAAIEFLKKQPPTPATLELLANVAEHSGDIEQALQTWRTLLRDPAQATPARAMHAAVLAVVRNQSDLAMQWLDAAHTKITEGAPEATDFWRMTGQLAQNQQRPDLAVKALRELIATPDASAADYDALIRLLQDDDPQQTAEIATLAWERFDLPRHLILALSLYANRSQWPSMRQLLDRLDPQPEAARHASAPLLQEPDFVRLMGLYHQNTGQFVQAGAWFEKGIRLTPDNSEIRQAMIWMLIDSKDHVRLRKLLSQYEEEWSQDEALHDALGAAYQALALPSVALQRYLTPRLAQHQQDFLWLMNYADTLDQNQDTDKSWRLRRHLLSQEWQSLTQATENDLSGMDAAKMAQTRRRQWLSEEGLDATQRVARARLTMLNQPGDPALATLRELLRLDRDALQGLSSAAAETAIGWLQDAQQYSAARGFMWQQYARSRSIPANSGLWEETVEDIRQTQTSRFETSGTQTEDAPLHLQLTESLLPFSDHAGTHVTSRKLGSLEEMETSAQWHLTIHPRLTMDMHLFRTQRMAAIPSQLQNPSQEQGIKLALRWHDAESAVQLRLERRISLAAYTPVQVEYEWRVDERLTLRMDAGLQLPAQESTVLRMAGMADRVGLALRYQATRRDQLSVEHWQDRFRLQTGGHLGSGQHSALTYTHSYRLEVPTLEFGAFWSQHHYRRHDLANLTGADLSYQQYLPLGLTEADKNYFLPDNFRFYGLQVSTNTRFQRDYTRAMLPYASAARTWHSQQGAGYSLQLGLAGSVLGADHLHLGWGMIRGSTQTQGLNREINVRYRLHF